MSAHFTPIGVVQGWSPSSMAEAARRLRKMGYSYLALGGTVPLRTPQIKACLRAIRDVVSADTRLHILGFAKADEIESFTSYGITSFDTTSPLIRAFKDARANYYLPFGSGLTYYTAIRVPQALENAKLIRLAKRGVVNQEALVKLERAALEALRAYDRSELGLEETLERTLSYSTLAALGAPPAALPGARSVRDLRIQYYRTLRDRPWNRCSCAICRAIGIEVIIFRASNRNKRRGIHNLGAYKQVLDGLDTKTAAHAAALDLFGNQSAAKSGTHDPLLRCEGG
jgi:hypothetical protein